MRDRDSAGSPHHVRGKEKGRTPWRTSGSISEGGGGGGGVENQRRGKILLGCRAKRIDDCQASCLGKEKGKNSRREMGGTDKKKKKQQAPPPKPRRRAEQGT